MSTSTTPPRGLEPAYATPAGAPGHTDSYRRPGSRAHAPLRPLFAGSGRRATYGSVAIDEGFGQRPVLWDRLRRGDRWRTGRKAQ